ncbi:MAG: AI-2E family transporter [bacterium]|nr:MAG: AI-2E family transporter [bacterium]
MNLLNRQQWFVVISTTLMAVFIYIARGPLFPFFIAFLLAYMLDPVLDRMESRKIPRTVSVALLLGSVIILALLAGFIIYPLLEQQVTKGMEHLPQYAAKMQEKLAPLVERISGYDKGQVNEMIENTIGKMGSLPLKILNALYGFAVSAVSSAAGVVATVFSLLLIPVAAFYFMRDIDPMKEKLLELVPGRYREKVSQIAADIDKTLSAFVRGQFTVALAMAFFYSAGLYLIGTPMGIFIGILAGLSNIVPYLALVTGFLPSLILTWLHFGDFQHLAYVLALFGIVQMVEGFYLTPKVMGESVGLHPVVIMLSILIGGMLFGIIGIIIAVPAAAVLKVFLAHLESAYRSSRFFTNKKDD